MQTVRGTVENGEDMDSNRPEALGFRR
jgi:hypothetical protein